MQPVMLIPKASHLVERVAERLLRSGALDDSAAQLLSQPDTEPAGDAGVNGVGGAHAEQSRRSSLFAPSPNLAAARGGMHAAAVVARGLADAPDHEEDPPEPPASLGSAEAANVGLAPPPAPATGP